MTAHICMFLNASLAGDQRVYKEARSLADAGYRVSIICNQEPREMSETWKGIEVISIPRRPSLLFPGRFSCKWLKTALGLKPDIIHAHDLNTLGRAWLAARLTGAKLVYDSHDYYQGTVFVLKMPGWRRWYYRRKEGFLLRRADRVIHVVPGLCPIVAEEFRVCEPLMIANFPMGDAPPRTRILHDMFSLAPETRVVIYEGLFALDRGLENLVASARLLRPGVAVVLLGEGYLKQRLKQLTLELGVKDRVKFIDAVSLEEFPVYCAAADIGVAIYENCGLSWEHGWSTKVFDYMKAGIPSLLSGSRATAQLLIEYDAGLVMEDISPEGIAREIEGLLADRERYEELCRNALAAWKEQFRWETEREKLLKMFKQLEKAG